MSYAVASTVAFIVISTALLMVSRRALRDSDSHGFYRFFAWECILGLVLLNLPVWGDDPLAPHQLASWLLLVASALLPLHAVRLLKRMGKPSDARNDEALFDFEKTSTLVTGGAFRYIRHPMYAALIFLAWGAFLKQFSWLGLALVLAATVLLFMTALRDEQECLKHFGEAYRSYMRGTRRFVPFVL
ncbi:isoprenylcysteine carboxylmethyltransferase family protein [Variovorax sp. J2P1-59]|uniref:methyltransferase family protein n=1 Tax=Variovorax flavidus TaxID=3053501 RepID=UPI002574B1D4|nr:isoprenylcysteine carboxylmethyltransferase family protein [Variovorax sp. J2P1-59]MDM0074469.1 isoprenylcysteine carboxylmethyltransferase family protein [Variovorax sp. J2P1-59]